VAPARGAAPPRPPPRGAGSRGLARPTPRAATGPDAGAPGLRGPRRLGPRGARRPARPAAPGHRPQRASPGARKPRGGPRPPPASRKQGGERSPTPGPRRGSRGLQPAPRSSLAVWPAHPAGRAPACQRSPGTTACSSRTVHLHDDASSSSAETHTACGTSAGSGLRHHPGPERE
jgi:hypothetical protein